MSNKKILFISGSAGLGHVTRDLAIANELHKQNPEIELSWLAADPARMVIKEAGVKLVPETELWQDLTRFTDNMFKEYFDHGKVYDINVMEWLVRVSPESSKNVPIFKQVVDNNQYDLIIGDETSEIVFALSKKHIQITPTFIMINDCFGIDTMTKNPLEKLKVYLFNRIWTMNIKRNPDTVITRWFIGELEDIADRKLGLLLPNRRDFAKERFKILGYVVQFDPQDYTDKKKIKTKLGRGQEPLVVCSIGGMSVGKVLLELCGQAYPLIKEKIPNLRMVLVCGPRLSPESLKVPEGVEVRGYVPALYEHFAACDLAIVQGGGTTTIELTALRRPFIYFPIEEHFEQQLHIAERLARHQAGIKMRFYQTTPQSLAEKVIANIGKEVTYPPIKTDGAQRAVQYIRQLLE